MIDRRKFLKGIAVLPLVPAAIRGWAEERAEALEPTTTQAESNVLAYAQGEPGAVTVVVPEGRLIKVSGMALMDGVNSAPAELRIYEGTNCLAAQANSGDGLREMHVSCTVRPKPGLHTYKLGYRGNVSMQRSFPPAIWVERQP